MFAISIIVVAIVSIIAVLFGIAVAELINKVSYDRYAKLCSDVSEEEKSPVMKKYTFLKNNGFNSRDDIYAVDVLDAIDLYIGRQLIEANEWNYGVAHYRKLLNLRAAHESMCGWIVRYNDSKETYAFIREC